MHIAITEWSKVYQHNLRNCEAIIVPLFIPTSGVSSSRYIKQAFSLFLRVLMLFRQLTLAAFQSVPK
jgi:hypothetical protein